MEIRSPGAARTPTTLPPGSRAADENGTCHATHVMRLRAEERQVARGSRPRLTLGSCIIARGEAPGSRVSDADWARSVGPALLSKDSPLKFGKKCDASRDI